MKLLAYMRSVAARFFDRSRVEREMDEELRSHIALRADDLARSGVERADAERRARLEFGGREKFKEEIRESLGAHLLEDSARDVRYGLRVLRKSPGFALVAVLTLALAIGANAIVFGILNGLILHPLKVPGESSLYGLEHGNEHSMTASYPDYLDIRDRQRSFDSLAAYDFNLVAVNAGEDTTSAWINVVSGNYFDVLGLQPYLGRMFHQSDEHGIGSAPYIVLGYNYWHTRFRDDRSVIGRVVRLNKHPFTIVGVAPPEFRGTLVFFAPDFYIPMVANALFSPDSTLNNRSSQSIFMMIGHLKPGVTPEQAVGDLNGIGAYLDKTYPKEHGHTTFNLARPGLYGNYLGSPVRAFISGLIVLAVLLLIAACTNLGSLFAARAADRSRDVALRLALGATRIRVLRQLLTEAVLIGLAGGALGLALSIVLLRALTAWHPIPKFPINVPVSPEPNVYFVAFLLAVVSGLLFGLVPVQQVFRTDPYQIVKAGSGSIGWRRMTLRDLLLVVQIAICAVLVTSSIVALRGLSRSANANYGFQPDNALIATTELGMAGYFGDQVPPMQKRISEALKDIPGVQSVAIGRPPLVEETFNFNVFTDWTVDFKSSNAAAMAFTYKVSPDYFRAARTTLLAGRAFSPHDDQAAPRVGMVNRVFARKVFGSEGQAIGGHFKLHDGTRVEVVGIVEDGIYGNLTEDPQPALFLPLLQWPMSETWIVIRTDRDPVDVAPAVRATLRGIDSGLSVYVQPWTKQLDWLQFPARVATMALGVMGAIGAVLAITGIFGMAAYSVSKRLKELGIRIAFGAQRRQVLGAALGRAFKLIAFGSAAGLALGILASQVLAFIVYEATPRDPLVLTSVVLVMLLLGLLATWIPAQRALSIDPLKLLREE